MNDNKYKIEALENKIELIDLRRSHLVKNYFAKYGKDYNYNTELWIKNKDVEYHKLWDEKNTIRETMKKLFIKKAPIPKTKSEIRAEEMEEKRAIKEEQVTSLAYNRHIKRIDKEIEYRMKWR